MEKDSEIKVMKQRFKKASEDKTNAVLDFEICERKLADLKENKAENKEILKATDEVEKNRSGRSIFIFKEQTRRVRK